MNNNLVASDACSGRSRRLRILLVGILAHTSAFGALPGSEFANWPADGYFPAYPIAVDERRVLLYAKADAVYDDNLFRVSDSFVGPILGTNDRSERYAVPGLGLHAFTKASLQRFEVNADAEYYLFDQFSDLNRWTYSADVGWGWNVAERLYGDLKLGQSLRLPDFAELQYASEDAIQQRAGHASANLKVLQRVELRGYVEEMQFEHEDRTRADLDNTVDIGILGLVYVSPKEYSIGAQYKYSKADYPNRQAVGPITIDNRYKEEELSLIFNKTFVEPGGIDLRIGHTDRTHEQVKARDFSGATGRLDLRYAMRAKVKLDLSLYRELRAVEEISASYADVRGGTIGPSWAPTSKTVVQFVFLDEHREFRGDPGFVITNQPPRTDRTKSLRLAAGYQPSEHLRVGLAYERGERSSNILYGDYEYNTVTLRIVGML